MLWREGEKDGPSRSRIETKSAFVTGCQQSSVIINKSLSGLLTLIELLPRALRPLRRVDRELELLHLVLPLAPGAPKLEPAPVRTGKRQAQSTRAHLYFAPECASQRAPPRLATHARALGRRARRRHARHRRCGQVRVGLAPLRGAPVRAGLKERREPAARARVAQRRRRSACRQLVEVWNGRGPTVLELAGRGRVSAGTVAVASGVVWALRARARRSRLGAGEEAEVGRGPERPRTGQVRRLAGRTGRHRLLETGRSVVCDTKGDARGKAKGRRDLGSDAADMERS